MQVGTISLPRSRAQWGLSEVGLGFVLLASALLTSWHSRRGPRQDPASVTETAEDPQLR